MHCTAIQFLYDVTGGHREEDEEEADAGQVKCCARLLSELCPALNGYGEANLFGSCLLFFYCLFFV